MADVRLIDANVLLVEVAHRNALDVIPGADFEKIWLYSTVQRDMFNIIKAAPTIDTVPVVRCRDCILRKTSGCPMKTSGTGAYIGHSMYDEGSDKTKDNGFCYKGKRREYT